MTYKRPLSPHITIHKWILSQVMSILHRVTAIGFSFGLFFICLWILSICLGPLYYSLFQLFFFNLIGQIIIIFISFCFCFYFIDEIRKLFWAFGLGLEISVIKISSYFVISFSIIALIIIFLFLL